MLLANKCRHVNSRESEPRNFECNDTVENEYRVSFEICCILDYRGFGPSFGLVSNKVNANIYWDIDRSELWEVGNSALLSSTKVKFAVSQSLMPICYFTNVNFSITIIPYLHCTNCMILKIRGSNLST